MTCSRSIRVALGAATFAGAMLAPGLGSLAQESGLDPMSPVEPSPAVVRTPEDEARRARVVARVGEATITLGEIEDDIARQSPYMRAAFRDPQRVREHVETMLRFELLAREADRRGYGDDAEVREARDQSAVQQLIRRDFDERITPESIPEADVQAYYDAHPEEFSRPEVRRASHVVVATRAEADQVLAEARAGDARTFRQLAQNRSLDQDSKQRGGDLRYFDSRGLTPNSTDPAVVAPVVEAVFALSEVGDVAGPIQVAGGFSIVKLTGIRPAEHRSREESTPGIRLRLWRDRRQAALESFVTRLREQRTIELHTERLSPIRFEQPQITEEPHGTRPSEEAATPEGASE